MFGLDGLTRHPGGRATRFRGQLAVSRPTRGLQVATCEAWALGRRARIPVAGLWSACAQQQARYKRGKRGKSSQLPGLPRFSTTAGQTASFSVDD